MSDQSNNMEQWDQHYGDLPLPEQEASWQDMKQKLDKDDRRRRVVPPFILNCAAWSLLGIALIAGGWFLFFSPGDKDETSRLQPETTTEAKDLSSSTDKSSVHNADGNGGSGLNNDKESKISTGDQSTITGNKQNDYNDLTSSNQDSKSGTRTTSDRRENGIARRNDLPGKDIPAKKNQTQEVIISNDQESRADNVDEVKPSDYDTRQKDAMTKKDVPNNNDKIDQGANTTMPTNDSAIRTDDNLPNKDVNSKKDSVTVVEVNEPLPAVADSKKTKEKKKSDFSLSAGLGMHQQIPTGEQKSVSFNYYGKPSTVTDYIPSVHLRLHYKDRLYAETGFRYGAPQAVPQFSYSKMTTVDTSVTKVNTTSTYLRKTYYHQLPLSLNYYIVPNWSVGAGGVYSIFHGAVAEEEVNSFNYQNMENSIENRMVNIKQFNDSFLYKTQMHILLQTEYSWKRFSLGLRYSKGLENYIKYTMPDGSVVEETNHSLEAILRYRLWQSGMQ